jgi:hypothetical protein
MKKSVLVFAFATMFGFASYTSVGQNPTQTQTERQQQDQRQLDQQNQDRDAINNRQYQDATLQRDTTRQGTGTTRQGTGQMGRDNVNRQSTEISVSELPQAVRKAAKEHDDSEIESVERRVLPTGETIYKVTYDSSSLFGSDKTKSFYANGREYDEDDADNNRRSGTGTMQGQDNVNRQGTGGTTTTQQSGRDSQSSTINVSELPQAVRKAAMEDDESNIESVERRVLPSGETVYKVTYNNPSLFGRDQTKTFHANGREYDEDDANRQDSDRNTGTNRQGQDNMNRQGTGTGTGTGTTRQGQDDVNRTGTGTGTTGTGTGTTRQGQDDINRTGTGTGTTGTTGTGTGTTRQGQDDVNRTGTGTGTTGTGTGTTRQGQDDINRTGTGTGTTGTGTGTTRQGQDDINRTGTGTGTTGTGTGTTRQGQDDVNRTGTGTGTTGTGTGTTRDDINRTGTGTGTTGTGTGTTRQGQDDVNRQGTGAGTTTGTYGSGQQQDRTGTGTTTTQSGRDGMNQNEFSSVNVSELPQAVQKAAIEHDESNIESVERKVLPTGETVYKVKYENKSLFGSDKTKSFYADGREYDEDDDNRDRD